MDHLYNVLTSDRWERGCSERNLAPSQGRYAPPVTNVSDKSVKSYIISRVARQQHENEIHCIPHFYGMYDNFLRERERKRRILIQNEVSNKII